MKSPKIIREGDRVKILNPEFVTRVGYELSFSQAYDIVTERDKEAVFNFMVSLGIISSVPVLYGSKYDGFSKRHTRVFNEIMRTLAYAEVGKMGHGGKERKLHTEFKPEFKDKIMKVHSKRCAKTGFYYAPSGGYDSWTGEYDYECGGLDKQKTHILLDVYEPMDIWYTSFRLEIESCNVEKIHE